MAIQRLLAGALAHVLEALGEQAHDVKVVERIEDELPGTPWAHEAHAAEEAQLVRDGRFRHPEQGGEVADVALAVREGVEDADARGIAQHFEGVGEGRDGVSVKQVRGTNLNM